MLNDINRHTGGFSNSVCSQPAVSLSNDIYARDMQEDMVTAINLLFKFKQELDKLHPNCTSLIEDMLQRRRY